MDLFYNLNLHLKHMLLESKPWSAVKVKGCETRWGVNEGVKGGKQLWQLI